jgi:subtilisin family serine protease
MAFFARSRSTSTFAKRLRWALSVATVAAVIGYMTPGISSGQVGGALAAKPTPAAAKDRPQIDTKSDKALGKLDQRLQRTYQQHESGSVPVFVTVAGSPDAVLNKMNGAHASTAGSASLVVGRIPATQLVKLAAGSRVLSVRSITFKMDGTPVGFTRSDPAPLTGAAKAKAIAAARASDVPYPQAPQPRPSQFDKFKKYNVLDAKTHNFTDAWKKNITGQGSTVAVFDGGTDWSHPDLIGANIARSDTGWPLAFDPFGTLQWLAAPEQIDEGLSWYTPTTPATCAASGQTCSVDFATRTGPSRNLPNPPGTAEHTYTFPKKWSKSGEVHLGSHPDDYALDMYGERPAFLVTDPNQAGVYDTIYVDLNDDHDFSDEKPVTKESPRSWRDLDGDGYVDLSGGMAYYISDGTGADGTPVPGGLEDFGLEVKRAPGALVAWTGDFDTGIEGHGTLCASNIVGQGVTNGNLPTFSDLPGGQYPAAVVGGAPDATAVPFGDIYFSFDFSTQFSYLLSNEHGIDVTSNSYGNSDLDNDGMDAPSQEADIWNTAFGGRTTALFSSGNGAPGYGTVTGPSPVTGVKVGASTQFGASGWDSIKRYSQVTDNDIANWSNRGPGATGDPGVDLVADGAYSPGSVNLSRAFEEGKDGQDAWETWGGTSRSTPVAAGATALVYQAYRKTHGSIPEGFYDNARRYLKSGANDLGYDGFTQGSGSLDAGRSVRLAEGRSGVTVSPDQWRPGDYRGDQFEAFPQTVSPGETAQQQFTLDGQGAYKISDRVLRRTDVESFNFTTSDLRNETPSLFNAPNYLIDLTRLVKQHKSSDLMVIRSNYPYNQFDPNDDYSTNQQWRMVTYDWTDINHDGRLWRDADHDGTVDNTPSDQTDNDGDPIPDFSKSEIQKGEYERLTYINQATNAYTNMVRDPAARMNSGLFLGFYHNQTSAAIPRTNFHVEVEFYKNQDFDWIHTPNTASKSFNATIDVPSDAPYGMYDASIVVSGHGQKSIVPVAVTVAATAQQDDAGQLTEPLSFGGADVAEAQQDSLYNNGAVFDAKDWGWRAESGDWRFFYFDVPKAPPAGTQFLAQTDFAGPSPHNDLDTLIFGPTTNSYQLVGGSDPIFAPYVLGTVGSSVNTNVGAGVWQFNTATGSNQELISAPAAEGMHALVEHEVNMQHDNGETHVPFHATIGSATVSPDHVEVSTPTDDGSFDVEFTSGIDLDGLSADAFGLSQTEVTTETAHQDNPNDPSTASVKKNLTLSHAGSLTVSTAQPNNDLDLYLLRDANGDGNFTADEIIAASAGPTGDESISVSNPPDGNYQVWVHGFAVAGTPQFPLTVDAVQGNDLTVSGVPVGPVAAGTPVTVHVAFDKPMTSGQDYFGQLQIGPTVAPSLLTVPVVVHRQ